MNKIKIKEQLTWGPCVLIYDLPKDIFNKIKSIKPEVSYKQGKKDGIFKIVEKISNRYGYSDDNISLIKSLLDGYFKDYMSKVITSPLEYNISGLWVNEYSLNQHITTHVHKYCDISFILYIQSNQDIIDKDENVDAGYTYFQYGQPNDSRSVFTNIYNNAHRPIDGELIIFPNNLLHYSVPFNIPNVERYTMSGNLQLITN